MPSNEFRVLLVGSGTHARETCGPALKSLAPEGVVLTAIVSPTDAHRLRAMRLMGVSRGYRTLQSALVHERVDAVLIAATQDVHEPLAIQALDAGCHVLCEKPIASDAASGRRMLAAARRAERVLAVAYQYPWVQPSLVDLAAAGRLDSTYRVTAHWVRANGIPLQRAFWDRPGAGAGSDLLGHLVSVMDAGVSWRPQWVTAYSWNEFGRRAHGAQFAGHDTLEALVGFDGGRTAHFLVSWAMNVPYEEAIRVTFHGTDATVAVPLTADGTAGVDCVGRVSMTGDTGRCLPPIGAEAAYRAHLRDWVRASRDGARLRFAPERAVAIQCIMDAAITSSLRGGARVAIETADDLAWDDPPGIRAGEESGLAAASSGGA